MITKYLSTIDNPFDPATDFDRWYAYDEQKGYHTCSYLARIARTSSSLTEAENQRAINAAIDDIVRLNINGMYIMTREGTEDE